MKQCRIIIVILSGLFFLLLLAACGTAESSPDTAQSTLQSVFSPTATPKSSLPVGTPVSPAPVSSSPASSMEEAPSSSAPTFSPAPVISLDLWCVESPVSGELLYYASLFSDASDTISLQVTVFPDTDSLFSGLSSSSPDLLCCERFELEEHTLSASSFDSIGYDVPVLLVNDAALEQACGDCNCLNSASFQRLCELASGAAPGTPFLAASSFTSVFENCLLQNDTTLSADRETNLVNSDYVAVYNLLAECAYSGTLVTDIHDFSSFLSQGTVCMFSSSSELAGQDLSGLSVLPFPVPEGFSDSPACTASEIGIAVLSDSPVPEDARSFFRWLSENGYADELSRSAGLIPSSGSGLFISDPLADALNHIYSEFRLITEWDRLPEETRCAFDSECRSAFSSF